MGCITSKEPFITLTEGDEKAFFNRYTVDRKLGEGEYGSVNLISEKDVSSADVPAANPQQSHPMKKNCYAVKVLRKGMVFKDNELFAAPPPDVLQRECNILRALQGKHYTLSLLAIYESSSTIYLVTEYCSGGMMMSYISTCYGHSGLTTEDIGRISFQLLDAVQHCAANGVIHRDIKPENIMFARSEPGADLKMIDFGCSAFDPMNITTKENHAPSSTQTSQQQENPKTTTFEKVLVTQSDGSQLYRHTTMVGSPFYSSPELFQHSYTNKTDVWSAGVTLYVLVAGYPADNLQKAFNLLQMNESPRGGRQESLKSLPNMPSSLPPSFVDMLDSCLIFGQKHRKTAQEILKCEFILQFYTNKLKDTKAEQGFLSLQHVLAETSSIHQTLGTKPDTISSTSQSIRIEGTVHRHSAYLSYEKFERSVTVLIATLLDKDELFLLIQALNVLLQDHMADDVLQHRTPAQHQEIANKRRLQVVTIKDLKNTLTLLHFGQCISNISNLPSYLPSYDTFAYDLNLLRQFSPDFNKSLPSKTQNKQKRRNGTSNSELDRSLSRKIYQLLNKSEIDPLGRSENSVSRKVTKLLSFKNATTGQMPVGEKSGNPMDTSQHKGTSFSLDTSQHGKGTSIHGNKVWDELQRKNASNNMTNSLVRTKRTSSMIDLTKAANLHSTVVPSGTEHRT